MLKSYPIKALGQIITGNTPSKSNSEYYCSQDIAFFKPDSLGEKEILHLKHSKEYISKHAEKVARIVPKGTVLFTCIGSIGKIGIVAAEKACFNQQINAIIPNDKISSVNYLCYALKYNRQRIQDIANAPVVPIINKTQFSDFIIQIHDKSEQVRIANILDQAQELIDKRKAQIEALDELIQSVFYDMFGDPIINSRQMSTKRVDEVVILQRGYDLPSKDRDESGNVNVWGANGVLSKHSENKVECGGIITGRSGSIGNVYYTKESFWPLNTTLFSKETYGNNIIYLCYLLKNFKIDRFVNGTGVPTLNRNLVHSEKIIDVPIELQNQFAEIVENIENQKELLNQSLIELENNFNSLMQRAFKGELF